MQRTTQRTLRAPHQQMVSAVAFRKFNKLIDRIEANFPEIVCEAESLASQIVDPSRATADASWCVLWNKPLYRWGRVENGDKWAALFQQSYTSNSIWTVIANPSGRYHVVRVGKGKGKSNDDFLAAGWMARRLKSKGVPMERLHSIIGSASCLSKRAAMSVAPFSDISRADADTITNLSQELGYGWGHVTVLHLLTDMGLACKPDIHLNATCRHLGLKINARKQPTAKMALVIVDFVKALVRARWGTDTGYWLRYADKCLMEASRQNLFSKPSWWNAEKKWLKVRGADPSIPGDCQWSIDGTRTVVIKSNAPERLLRQFIKAAKKRPSDTTSVRSFAYRHRDTIARLQTARKDGRVATFTIKARAVR